MPYTRRGFTVSDKWFARLVVAAVFLGFVALVATGIAATVAILTNQRHSQWVSHTYEVERSISRFRVTVERLEAARRGYLLRVDDNGLASTFANTASAVGPALADMKRLTGDNPRQQAHIAQLQDLALKHLASLRHSVVLAGSGRRAEAIADFNADESLPLIRIIRRVAERMMAEEDRLLTERNRAQAESLNRFFVILIAAGVLLIAVGIGTMWVVLRYTNDLTRSRDALRRLNSDLEGAVRERTVNLQRANDEIQRFAYIVSHDLRSPLVNVMGFTAELEAATKSLTRLVEHVEAEAPHLIDADARVAATEDLPEAIGFIRTSTQKMDRLINAILRLSREGRRPIMPERLDMVALGQSIADSLKHRIDEIGATVTIAQRMPEIVNDRVAIEQIFSNLIENASKYLRAGVPGRIEMRGQVAGNRAVFEVIDNGRGVDPKDHERIFDLFRRSGVQDQPGEGIGLAHTRALAYRLGGTIVVDSTLGAGSTFRVDLPLVFTAEQGIPA
ncbi:sensor histidine kinase [Sphingomonas nostoxanthinifaciens]|uniref:sensor histidine kinase n=1 Tax=Sphingomonas nostoxanthinifaciens TaxID=2872652 RepID=UPI001CC1F79A|nr:sensor histidine kinase [Sphingomonas nostoxanthinifaciens]UAK24700.1 CHASE3 domain-containing protein [Sphingomonas nostoxanthinifaciens]